MISTEQGRPSHWTGRSAMLMAGQMSPHFLFETSKRKCAAPGGKEKMFGGSVCAGADLLPPAGEGRLSRAAVRDGNAPPLGNPLAWGGLGYPLRLSPLPLAWRSGTARSPGASQSDPAVRFLIPLSTLHSPLYLLSLIFSLLSLPLPVLSCRRAGGGLFAERSAP